MVTASATVGSWTCTGWKRRASAGSFSKYCLYSRQVVAAIVRSSPRARAGLSRLAASLPPAWAPAPISVWASSMNRMTGVGAADTSSITPCRRRSNSPLMLAPACSRPRSRVSSSTPCSAGGTSPRTMRRARPSTSAVLPTPASPTRIGLFFRRRVRMSIIWRSAASRHSTGSSRPARACSVRLWVKRCNAVSAARLGLGVCARVNASRRSTFRRASNGW